MKGLRIFLFPFSIVYGIIIFIRNKFYDYGLFKSFKIAVPVISVGNIMAGGTGKTPAVEYIIEMLLKNKKKVAVLSRGYKRSTKGTLLISDGKNILVDSSKSGDEPFQIAKKFDNVIVAVDENRTRMAKYLVNNFKPDVIVLDDAFQHRKVKRDFNIVNIDINESPFENILLPAGNRREFLSSLKRADCVNLTSCNNIAETKILREKIKNICNLQIFFGNLKPESLCDFNGRNIDLLMVKNKKVFAFSGIAKNENFINTLKSLGCEISSSLSFKDHHNYNGNDIDLIISEFKKCDPEFMITTEKDYSRLCSNSLFVEKLTKANTLYLKVKFNFLENEQDFINNLLKVF